MTKETKEKISFRKSLPLFLFRRGGLASVILGENHLTLLYISFNSRTFIHHRRPFLFYSAALSCFSLIPTFAFLLYPQASGFHRQRGVPSDAVCYLLFKHSVFVLTLFHQHALLDGLCSHVTFCELRVECVYR